MALCEPVVSGCHRLGKYLQSFLLQTEMPFPRSFGINPLSSRIAEFEIDWYPKRENIVSNQLAIFA
jgi:hypothetical protein